MTENEYISQYFAMLEAECKARVLSQPAPADGKYNDFFVNSLSCHQIISIQGGCMVSKSTIGSSLKFKL